MEVGVQGDVLGGGEEGCGLDEDGVAGGEVVFVYVAWGGGSEGDVAAQGSAGEGVQEEGLAGQETA